MDCETVREEPFTERFLIRAQSQRGDLNDEKRIQLRMKTSEEIKKRISLQYGETILYNSDEEMCCSEETDLSSPETVIMAAGLRMVIKTSKDTSETAKSNSRFYVSQSLSSCSSEESVLPTTEEEMKRTRSLHSSIDTLDGKFSDKDLKGSCDSILSLKGLRHHVSTNIMSYFKKRNKNGDDGDNVSDLQHHDNTSLENVTTTHNIEPASSSSSSSMICDNNEKNDTNMMIHTLLKQVSVQKACMIQSSKVLALCKSDRSFCLSTEIVEAERSLLLATQKYQTLLAEIQRLQFLENPNGRTYLEHGNLILKNISFSLRDSFIQTYQEECERLEFWFLYVATYRHLLVASKAMCYTGENQLNFSEPISLENLVDDFKIVIDVYLLRLRKKQIGKLHSFPVLRKLPWFNSKEKQMQQIQTSQFYLVGTLHLHRHDLKSPCWILTKNFPSSPLQGYVDMFPSISLKLKMEYTGFLSVLTESKGFLLWQRQWCQLSEYNLKYWNYPNHQDNTIPVGVVDLRKCITDCINVAPRELCARPNTLMLETIKPASGQDIDTFLTCHKSTYTIIRHFFSADNKEQLDAWREKLNYVVNVLKTWNIECDESMDI